MNDKKQTESAINIGWINPQKDGRRPREWECCLVAIERVYDPNSTCRMMRCAEYNASHDLFDVMDWTGPFTIKRKNVIAWTPVPKPCGEM